MGNSYFTDTESFLWYMTNDVTVAVKERSGGIVKTNFIVGNVGQL